MEAIFGTIVGFVAFGIIWFFLLKPKNNQASNDELKIKDEELKNAQIDLATRDAELKAAEDAKKELNQQLDDKKREGTNLYKKVDGIVEGVGEYKSISEKLSLINPLNLELKSIKIKATSKKTKKNVGIEIKFSRKIPS